MKNFESDRASEERPFLLNHQFLGALHLFVTTMHYAPIEPHPIVWLLFGAECALLIAAEWAKISEREEVGAEDR